MKTEEENENMEQVEKPETKGVPYWIYWLSLFLVAVICIIGMAFAPRFLRVAYPGSGSALSPVEQAYSLINQSYFGELEDSQLIDGAIEGLTQAVDDPYTDYLPEEEANFNDDTMSGEFQGIGAEVMKEGDYVKIVAPIDGSPAERAGLQPNDIIKAIDGESTQGLALNEVVKQIRGEEGTEVTLTIQRAGAESQLTVKREAIPIETVQADVIDSQAGLGHISISKFSETTYDDLVAALKDFEKAGIDRVIFDVRQNPGGLLTSAVEISNIFVEAGQPIMSVENSNGQKEEFLAGEEYGDYHFQGQAVLLVNEGSASASEILAGAMKSQGIPLIGKQTFGKGTVQSVLPLTNEGNLKMTTARWLTAEGEWVNEKGIRPDQEVDQPAYSQLLWIDSSERYEEGQKSDEIKNINAVLHALGYEAADSDSFTSQTSQAVKNFQSSQGLQRDGVVTGETANRLMEQLREKIKNNDRQLEAAIDYLQA